IFLPSTPPEALISSTAICTASFNETSEMAMVPLRECNTPILTVLPEESAVAVLEEELELQDVKPMANTAPRVRLRKEKSFILISLIVLENEELTLQPYLA